LRIWIVQQKPQPLSLISAQSPMHFIKSPEHASIIWYWIAGIQMNTVSQEYATYWQNMAKNWPEILQVKPTLRNIMKPSSGRMRLKSCSSSDNSL